MLCRCAKSWSDACYLDFVSRERLTDADRRALNQRAMEYAQQVWRRRHCHVLRPGSELYVHMLCCAPLC